MTNILPKGTTVRVRTNNGGEIVAALVQAHRPTYDAVIAIGDADYAIIQSYRITSVEVVA